MFYLVFVRGSNHLIVPEGQADIMALDEAGFLLVWDSAPSEFAGANYAAKFYAAPTPVQVTVKAS